MIAAVAVVAKHHLLLSYTDRHADIQTDTDRQTDRHTQTDTDRQTDRDTETDTDKHKHTVIQSDN